MSTAAKRIPIVLPLLLAAMLAAALAPQPALIIAIDLVRGSTTRWYTVPQLTGTCKCGMRERNEGHRLRPSPFRCWAN